MKLKRRVRRKKPEIIFWENSFKGFSEDIKNQTTEIRAGIRKNYELGPAIGVGLLRGLLSLIFR